MPHKQKESKKPSKAPKSKATPAPVVEKKDKKDVTVEDLKEGDELEITFTARPGESPIQFSATIKKIIAKKRKPFLLECSDGKVLYSLGVLFCAEFDHALLVGTKHFSLPSFVVVGGLFILRQVRQTALGSDMQWEIQTEDDRRALAEIEKLRSWTGPPSRLAVAQMKPDTTTKTTQVCPPLPEVFFVVRKSQYGLVYVGG
jgi:hypothetical protein